MPNPDPPSLTPLPEPASTGSLSDLQGVIRLVLERRLLIVSCLVLALIAAAIYSKLAPRVYEASTTIEVEQEDATVIKVDHVVSEDMHGLDVLNTVAQKLSNLALLAQVLEQNHLLLPEQTIETNGSQTLKREFIISQFAHHVGASLRRNTRLIDITVRNTDPRLAAQLANSLVTNYLEQDALIQQTANEGASAFLRQEADRLKKKLEVSDQALQDYRKQIGSVSLDQNQDIITPQLQDLSKRLTQSNAELILAQGAYLNSLDMTTNIADLLAYPQVAADPDVVQISTEVARLENDFAVIRQRYRAKHPKYILTESSLGGLKGQLADTVLKVRTRIQESMRIAYESALTNNKGLETQLHDTETKAMQLSDSSVRFNILTREVQADQALFDSVISRLGETDVAAQITPARIRVIQPALVPELPASPKVRLVIALAIFGGLAVGLGISFTLNNIDTSLRSPDEVEHYLALAVLGTIPKLSEIKGKGPAAILDPNSTPAELFRTLRATLSMLGKEDGRKTFLFTSSLPGEGKTFISVNYAASLAQQGLRTLLVDLDLRHPMIEKVVFGKTSGLPGVTDYFLGSRQFDELCQQHQTFSRLFCMAAGSFVPNPAELLSQANLPQLLNEALAHFDRVVIDTSPLLPVGDTLLLAAKVQTVVLVVQGFKTSRKDVERSVQLLKNAGSSISGVVLNQLPHGRLSSYPYQGYGYGYGKSEAQSTPANAC